MQYSQLERELNGSPLKNTTNDAHYATSPVRAPGSNSKTRNLMKSGSMKSRGSLNGSPSPVKKNTENRDGNSHRSNDNYSSPKRHQFSSGKKQFKINNAPYGKPIEIIKGKLNTKCVNCAKILFAIKGASCYLI